MEPTVLRIKGVGHIPSFKNAKVPVPLKNGKTRIMMTKSVRARMKSITDALESELRSSIPMDANEILTVNKAQSWMRSHMPLDDSSKWIASLSVDWQQVKSGEEGAIIIIDEI